MHIKGTSLSSQISSAEDKKAEATGNTHQVRICPATIKCLVQSAKTSCHHSKPPAVTGFPFSPRQDSSFSPSPAAWVCFDLLIYKPFASQVFPNPIKSTLKHTQLMEAKIHVGAAAATSAHGLAANWTQMETCGLAESSGLRYHIWSQPRSDGEGERLDNSFV